MGIYKVRLGFSNVWIVRKDKRAQIWLLIFNILYVWIEKREERVETLLGIEDVLNSLVVSLFNFLK